MQKSAIDRRLASDLSFQRAWALHQQGRLTEAVRLYEAILKSDANHFGTLQNLGLLNLHRERHDAALRLLRKAIRQNPHSATAHNSLGRVLDRLNRFEEAVIHFKRALQIDPEYTEARVRLASLLRILGRFAEAQEALGEGIERSPRKTILYLNISNIKKFMENDPHLLAMEKLEHDASLTDQNRIWLYFSLGKACADLDQHDKSFRHFSRGNALKRALITYDEATTLTSFDRIRAKFTREGMWNHKGQGHSSNTPIFIVGMPRSGTTLVEQIVSSHPDVFAGGEQKAFEIAISQFEGFTPLEPSFFGNMSGLGHEQLSRIGALYVSALKKIAPNAARITDKLPSNFRFIGLIHLVLPEARIIHVRRDPLDTCLSNFSILFAQDFVPYSYDLGELGRYYCAYEALMAHWREILPADVMLEVRYEELVVDFERQVRRILEYCGLTWNEACLRFHENKRPVRTASEIQVRQPIYRTSLHRPRPSPDLIWPLLEALGID